jgi:MFS family permease
METQKSTPYYQHDISLDYKAVIVWLAASLFTCFQFCTQVIAGPMTRELMENFDLDAVSISYAVSSFFYMYLLMQLPAGILLDRYKTKYLMPLTCIICTCGCFLMGMADNVYTFVLARMVCGFGAAFGFIGTMRILRNYFHMKYIALFIGLTEMLGFFMTAVCENLFSYFLPIVGYHVVLFYMSFVGLTITLLMLICMQEKFAPSYEYAPPSKRHLKTVISELLQLLKDKQMWYLGLIAFSFFSLVTAFCALWGVPSLVKIHSLSLIESTQVVSFIFIGIAVGGPFVGYVGGRLKNKQLIISGCGVFCASLMYLVIYTHSPSFVFLATCLFLCGLFSCCYLLSFTIANEIVPPNLSGTSMGLINMITMTSALIMQPVMGYLVSLDGIIGMKDGAPLYPVSGYERACLAIVILFLIAGVLSTRLKSANR